MWAHQKRTRGARIGTTQWAAVARRSTPTSTSRRAASAGLLTGLLAVLFGAALATAAPAAAIDDPTRPDGRVTHGPSCRPGGLVVEVVAGTAPYTVRLATTRTPSGEDEASLQPGETVVLRTGDVAYGETIDGRLEYAAQDGTGVTFVDELEEYSFTRPDPRGLRLDRRPVLPGVRGPGGTVQHGHASDQRRSRPHERVRAADAVVQRDAGPGRRRTRRGRRQHPSARGRPPGTPSPWRRPASCPASGS